MAGNVPQTYICPKCYRTFPNQNWLKNHYCTPVELKHRCQHCDKVFETKTYLTKHSVVHSEERPHVCVHCGAAFKLSTQLNDHIKARKENNVKCDSCIKFFCTTALFKEHLYENVNGTHKCQDCQRSFFHKCGLTEHWLGADCYSKCPICDESFANSQDARTHKTEIHSSHVFYVPPQEVLTNLVARARSARRNRNAVPIYGPRSEFNAARPTNCDAPMMSAPMTSQYDPRTSAPMASQYSAWMQALMASQYDARMQALMASQCGGRMPAPMASQYGAWMQALMASQYGGRMPAPMASQYGAWMQALMASQYGGRMPAPMASQYGAWMQALMASQGGGRMSAPMANQYAPTIAAPTTDSRVAYHSTIEQQHPPTQHSDHTNVLYIPPQHPYQRIHQAPNNPGPMPRLEGDISSPLSSFRRVTPQTCTVTRATVSDSPECPIVTEANSLSEEPFNDNTRTDRNDT